MNGIKLKSDEIPPLKIERIKWISLIILSHLFSFMLVNTSIEVEEEVLPVLQAGNLRLQIQLISQLPDGGGPRAILIMTEDKKLVTNRAKLITKINSKTSLDSITNEFLIELPEEELKSFIRYKDKKLFAYPASQKISKAKLKPRSKNYEIHF